MPSIVLTDLARAESIADCRPCLRLLRSVVAPATDCWLFYSSVHHRGCLIAPDPALMPRWGRLLPALA